MSSQTGGMMSENWQANMSPDKWKTKLDLTDEQVDKWNQALKDRDQAIQPLADRTKDNLRKLDDQIKNNASEADLRSTLDQLDSDHKAMETERERFKDQMRSVLTAKQQAQMVQSMGENGRAMRRHHTATGNAGEGGQGSSQTQGEENQKSGGEKSGNSGY
jgi:Spy/CpxP family protein refolding chaperone